MMDSFKSVQEALAGMGDRSTTGYLRHHIAPSQHEPHHSHSHSTVVNTARKTEPTGPRLLLLLLVKPKSMLCFARTQAMRPGSRA